MPAMRVVSRREDEFAVRERATAARLGRFRGDMSDLDFAQLVSEVLRLRDKGDGRQSEIADAFTLPEDKHKPVS